MLYPSTIKQGGKCFITFGFSSFGFFLTGLCCLLKLRLFEVDLSKIRFNSSSSIRYVRCCVETDSTFSCAISMYSSALSQVTVKPLPFAQNTDDEGLRISISGS